MIILSIIVRNCTTYVMVGGLFESVLITPTHEVQNHPYLKLQVLHHLHLT